MFLILDQRDVLVLALVLGAIAGLAMMLAFTLLGEVA